MCEYPKGLIRFVNIFLDQGVQKKDKQLLLYTFLKTEFEDQTEYKRVCDLPEDQIILAIKALEFVLGIQTWNGLYDIYKKKMKLEKRKGLDLK